MDTEDIKLSELRQHRRPNTTWFCSSGASQRVKPTGAENRMMVAAAGRGEGHVEVFRGYEVSVTLMSKF